MTQISREVEQQLVVVDVETSGTNFAVHNLLTAAFVPVDPVKPTLEVCFKHEHIVWAPRAREMFGGYESIWRRNAVPVALACSRIVEYVRATFSGPVTIVAHNVAFDFTFLRTTFQSAGVMESAAFSHRAVDTHTLLFLAHVQGKLPKSALNSSGAFEHFGIAVPAAERHTALGDAKATRELLIRLMGIL